MTMTMTSQEAAAVLAVQAIAEVIRSLGAVPSGHLYARLMDKLTLEQYTALIDLLKRMGLVTEKNHLLRWVEPKA